MALNQYGISPQRTDTSDSTVNFLQSMNNLLSSGGAQAVGKGQADYGTGISDFAPAETYWQNILSGNKSEMESAIAPEKNDILSQYRARRKQIAATGSRSGGTNEATATSEYSQAGDIAALLQKLRPQAAKESSDIAGKIAQLGLSESGVGLESSTAALQGALAERGQDITKRGQNFNLFDTLIGLL
jgi:hypothetical protein